MLCTPLARFEKKEKSLNLVDTHLLAMGYNGINQWSTYKI